MGDVFWNGLYPLIDASSDGSTQGMVDAVSRVLDKIDADTKVIPGHGPVSNKAGLENYHRMLSTVLSNVQALKNQGKSLEEIIAAKPTAEFDEQWGKGLFTPDQWVGVVYSAL